MNEEQRKEIEEGYRKNEPCLNCPDKRYCGGPCIYYYLCLFNFIIAEVERAEKDAVLKYDKIMDLEKICHKIDLMGGRDFSGYHLTERRKQALKNLGGEK